MLCTDIPFFASIDYYLQNDAVTLLEMLYHGNCIVSVNVHLSGNRIVDKVSVPQPFIVYIAAHTEDRIPKAC